MPKNYEGFITCSARQKYFLLVSIFLTFLTLVFMKTQCVGDKLLLFVFKLAKQENRTDCFSLKTTFCCLCLYQTSRKIEQD